MVEILNALSRTRRDYCIRAYLSFIQHIGLLAIHLKFENLNRLVGGSVKLILVSNQLQKMTSGMYTSGILCWMNVRYKPWTTGQLASPS